MELLEIALLTAGGFVAGVVNTLAGGGSLLTIPLLVLIGLPRNMANGSNRLGILVQCSLAVWSFRAQGICESRRAVPVLMPLAPGLAQRSLPDGAGLRRHHREGLRHRHAADRAGPRGLRPRYGPW